MASAVHCQLNPQVRPFVPTTMTPKLAYRRGKRKEGEEPVSKHHIHAGDGRWTGRRRMNRLSPRRESKIQGKNGDRERGEIEKVTERRKILARKRRRRGRAERQLRDRAKEGIKHVRVDGRSQLPRTTSGRWRWMGRTECNGR